MSRSTISSNLPAPPKNQGNLSKSIFGDAVAVAANFLREQIVSGLLVGGTQLRQQQVALELGVSHIPVREAFKILEAEGFVVCHPRRGAFVADLTLENAEEIWDLRWHLEPLAVRYSVPNASAVDLDKAEALMGEAANSTDHATWMRLNWDFHRALYVPANKPMLIEHIGSLWNNVDRYCTLLTQTQSQKHQLGDHRKLIKAYRNRDIELVTNLVKSHMKTVEEKVLSLLRKRLVGI
jgi:DNA-binding GntR family transcriptional regulator